MARFRVCHIVIKEKSLIYIKQTCGREQGLKKTVKDKESPVPSPLRLTFFS